MRRSAALLGVALAGGGRRGDRAAGGGERRAWPNRILRRVRDYAEVRAEGLATLEVTREAIELLEVDALGWT